MHEILGTIITTEESPSTTEFSFVINNNSEVKKGQYVQVTQSNGILFGHVSEIYKSNRYFERAESVAEFEKNSGMDSHFPSSSWEYTIVIVKILGIAKHSDDGPDAFQHSFKRAFVPPSPGLKVQSADNELLRQFLGFQDNGFHIGAIEHHDVPAKICMTRLVQKHLAILAMSGAGKSHLSSVLLEEILDRKKQDGRIAVVVIDIHGEYVGFQHDPNYGSKTKVIDGNEISIPLRKMKPEMIMSWLPNLSTPQREVLRHAMLQLKQEKKDEESYGFKDLLDAVEKTDVSKDDVKRALKRSLSELKRYRFISKKTENPKLITEIQPGNLTILDFSTIDSLRKKQILVAMISRRLFNLRKKNQIPPFLLLVEEAHNFAQQKAEEHEAVSRSIIETIAREGRKFGASLCLISQRPVNLSTTALSQCNTHIILRVTNPNDLDHIQMSSEGIDSRIAKSITGLKVGEAIVVGAAVNYPVFVSVRNRKSTKRERGAPLHQQAIEFESEKEKKEEQVEAFL
ncbi:ATP-binding protein [Candidatus Micrarchaeota archaeon]|nr:ATP-binding protein [Candidatus Micrarchaeota archaeon]MBU1166030.1 ATP-binding protein [Candidatus Micrarchaeota archaeon]MBU1886355.1 ATP-binding protein [Candidatus Micrarchaeota archaeon]